MRYRLQSIGVSVSETNPDTRIAMPIVAANSWNNRPTNPPRNRIGMKTATREMVIERIVKPISLAPSSAARQAVFPISMWRTMFSSITMASSTTKPTAKVSAISERLSRLYPSRYITAKVPTRDMGSARLGITVAVRFLRNRKITITTRQMVRSSVNFTSVTDSLMNNERSKRTSTLTDAGSCARRSSTRRRTPSATSTVLVPGCFWTARTIPREPLNQAATRLSWTPSITWPTSWSRTGGAPFRWAMIRGRNAAASGSCPLVSMVQALSFPHSTPVGWLVLPLVTACATSSSPIFRAASACGLT